MTTNRGDIKLVIDQLNQICEPLLTSDYDNINNAVDMLETLSDKVAQQAAVIEELRLQLIYRNTALIAACKFYEARGEYGTLAHVTLEQNIAIPTDSKQILADWMREQLGEPIAVVDDAGVVIICAYSYKPEDKLFKLPECLK